MNGIPNPAAIIIALAKIEREGWLSDLRHAIFNATRGPRNDLEVYPDLRATVEGFAKLAQELVGGSPADWKQAACEALLPETRQGIVLDIIEQFEQRADEAAIASQAAGKLARERGHK